MSHLRHFGRIAYSYTGRGSSKKDHHDLSGSFRLVQLSNANIYLHIISKRAPTMEIMFDPSSVFQDGTRFIGKTRAGANANIVCTNLTGHHSVTLPVSNEGEKPKRKPKVDFTFLSREAIIEHSINQASTIIFNIVNLRLPESVVHVGLDGVEFILRRVDDYANIVRNNRAIRGIDITVEASAELSDTSDLATVKTRISDLCTLLTLAQGTHITWISYSTLTTDKQLVTTYHRNVITRNFSQVYLIESNNSQMTSQFISTAFYKLQAAGDNWSFLRVLQEYIESKTENNMLESRALRAAICVEILKHAYLLRHKKETVIAQSLIDKRNNRLEAEINKSILQTFPEVSPEQAGVMAKNSRGLNYYQFKKILSEMCSEVNLQIDNKKLQRFVQLRNNLVHRGSFGDSKDGNYAQYLFIDDFVGRFLLATLGFISSTDHTYASQILRQR